MITTTYSTGKETKSQKLKCLIQIHKADKWMHKETETRVSESYFVTHADVRFNCINNLKCVLCCANEKQRAKGRISRHKSARSGPGSTEVGRVEMA